MRNLIIINGVPGVGKTTVGKELSKTLSKNIFLDGDWLFWSNNPFNYSPTFMDITYQNTISILKSFLSCGEFDNVILCRSLHSKSGMQRIASALSQKDVKTHKFTLLCDKEVWKKRFFGVSENKRDEKLLKEFESDYYHMYNDMDTQKVDTTNLTVEQVAELLKKSL